MKLIVHTLLHLLTLLAISVRAENVGVIANKPLAAFDNFRRMQVALNAGKTITLPPGDIYVDSKGDGPLLTPAKVSCGRIETTTAGGYSIDPTPQYGQIGTRIISQSGCAFLRVRGAGLIVLGPLELIGDSTSDAIQLEGRSDPATGRHAFTGLRFRNWGCAFHALAEPAEQHADNSKVVDCETANVGCVFRSDNQQSVNWYFGGLVTNNLGGPAAQLVCDIRRGGLVTIERLVICHPRVTIFQVQEFSPNSSRLVCRDVEFDRVDAADAYLTALKYAGPDNPEPWRHWFVDCDGFAAMKLPAEKLIDAPPSLNKQDIHVNVRSLY